MRRGAKGETDRGKKETACTHSLSKLMRGSVGF